MKKSTSILIILLQVFIAQSQPSPKYLISNDTTWSSDTIIINQNIVIDSHTTLQIDPGVYIEFQGNYSLEVYGKLHAMGIPNDSIIFTINNPLFIDDTSTTAGGWGGIRFLTNTTDTSILSYCRFSYGKAVMPGVSSSLNNVEENKGGAIYGNGYEHLFISHSYFYHNKANHAGGGLIINNCISFRLENSLFENNETYHYGGGALIKNCIQTSITDNIFVRNEAFSFNPVTNSIGGVGGGLAIYCNSNVTNNRFFNNNSVNGALYFSSDSAFIFNNIITNNMGPGMLVNVGYFGSYNLINNTIVNNFGYDPGGCGIYFFSNRAHMRNNIVFGNDCDRFWGEPNQIYNPYPNGAKADFAYSCNPDEPIYYEGEGNIKSDPLFVNPTAGAGPDYDGLLADWSLQDNSPCINAGTPDTAGLFLPETDLAENPRIFGNRIDMGAYENQHVWVKINDSPVFAHQIKVYPNPGTDRIMVALPENTTDAWIELMDGKGQRVLLERVYANLCIFTPTHLPAGIYFYRIYNRDQVFKKGKWVKK